MASDSHLDTNALRPSGALLATQIALGGAIDRGAVAYCEHDATTLDLLLRLELAETGSLRSVELCRQLLLSPSHISRMIDKAEAKGLVQRRRDVDDRRAQQVVITASGRDVVADFVPLLSGVIDRVITSQLSREEIDTLVSLLERIEAAAREDSC